MYILGILLIIIGLFKLYLIISLNNLEINELTNSLPEIPLNLIKFIISLDGFACFIGGLILIYI